MDARLADFGGRIDIDNSRECIGLVFYERVPHFVEVPFHEVQVSVVVEHFSKDVIVGFDAALRNEDILRLFFRIQSTPLLPVIDGRFDIEGTTQQSAVLEGVGVPRLVVVEEFEEVFPFRRLELHPRADGFIDEMPVRVCGSELVNQGGLSSTDISLDGDKDGLRLLHSGGKGYF